MIDLPLVFLGGILGSSHCLGMCGAFVLSIGMGATGTRRNLIRQLVYSGGRVFTYGFLGLTAAFAGIWLGRRSGTLLGAQAGLSLLAGLILVVQGLTSLGLSVPTPWKKQGSGSKAACLAGSFARPFLMSPKLSSVFVAGILNGFLPCGLVYGYLALASSTGGIILGPAVMIVFGLGTIPVLVLLGLGASVLSQPARRNMFRIAGVCVLITGLHAFGRGWISLRNIGDAPKCPACESNEEPSFSILGRITEGGE